MTDDPSYIRRISSIRVPFINYRLMRFVLLTLLLILPAASAQEASVPVTIPPERQARDKRIVARFAPVIYQGVGDQHTGFREQLKKSVGDSWHFILSDSFARVYLYHPYFKIGL